MSLIEFAQSREDAAAVGQAMLLAQALLNGSHKGRPPKLAYAGQSIESLRENEKRPFGVEFGVLGVGVVVTPAGLRAVILHSSDETTFRPQPIMQVPALHSAVQSVIPGGLNVVDDAVALSISDPQLLAAPGDPVSSAVTGTAGVQLNWGAGLVGILTAGHVCKSTSNAVTVGGMAGSVALALDPTSHGGSVEADVSVIQLTTSVPATSQITSTTVATGGDSVTIATRSGKSVTTKIMGLLQWLWLPSSNCTCGQVYLTTTNVTVSGDSGAPAKKGSELVGHVIAGSPGMTTFIQAIDYQLQEIRVNPTFAAARL